MISSLMKLSNTIHSNALSHVMSPLFSDYIYSLKGGRQFKPQPNQFSRTETGFVLGPALVGKPERKPNFEPGSSFFGYLLRWKAYRHWLGALLYKECTHPQQLRSRVSAGEKRQNSPPSILKRGAFVVVPMH